MMRSIVFFTVLFGLSLFSVSPKKAYAFDGQVSSAARSAAVTPEIPQIERSFISTIIDDVSLNKPDHIYYFYELIEVSARTQRDGYVIALVVNANGEIDDMGYNRTYNPRVTAQTTKTIPERGSGYELHITRPASFRDTIRVIYSSHPFFYDRRQLKFFSGPRGLENLTRIIIEDTRLHHRLTKTDGAYEWDFVDTKIQVRQNRSDWGF